MVGLTGFLPVIISLLCMTPVELSLSPNGEVSRDDVVKFISSSEYNYEDFTILFWKFYDSNATLRQLEPTVWEHNLNSLIDSVINLKDPVRFRSIVQTRFRENRDGLVFDPTKVLYMVIEKNGQDDVFLGKLIRSCLGLGANPLVKYHDRTAAEIVIENDRPNQLAALLETPSPISGDELNMRMKHSDSSSTELEIYRTNLIRQAIRVDKGSNQLGDVLKGAHYYTFVDRYLTKELIVIGFTLVVFTLIFFLYQLRIKRVPINSKLMIPRIVANRNPWWLFLTYSVATLMSSVPTSNLFECMGIGLASFGGVVWSYIFTGRSDVALVLVLCIVGQSLITLSAYYFFAPTNDNEDSDKFEEEIDPSSHLYRVMFYPKSRDISQALMNCAIYLVANTLSFMILFSALDPVHKMYTDCPGVSISDTYGHSQTLTRFVAITWDVVIFYCISLRIYRVNDTVNVYGLLARSGGQKNLPI